jgi:ribosomal protein S18 acetylase RimI-like enzyme
VKNIPIFTSEFGVASLILEEIPFKKEAYIRIQSSCDPDKLLSECVSFCKMAGADHVFATGNCRLDQYPLHTEIIRMECCGIENTSKNISVCQMTYDTLQQWCDVYNTYMRGVPTASTMTIQRLKDMVQKSCCYFVFEGNSLLGIGKAEDLQVDAIVAIQPGRGEDVMRALCGLIDGQLVSVEVATNNIPAISLYRKMGFEERESVVKWYCVYNK